MITALYQTSAIAIISLLPVVDSREGRRPKTSALTLSTGSTRFRIRKDPTMKIRILLTSHNSLKQATRKPVSGRYSMQGVWGVGVETLG